ncbi:MAG: NAD-dependent epimerase/dehydratase family protein [Cytophagaceae bacterium]
MKVLVTGGAGYVGSELVQKLINDSSISKVIVYDNLSRENYNLFIQQGVTLTHNKVEFEFGDILDSRKIKKAISKVDVVYHCAARVSTPFASIDSHQYEQVNHWGTAELIYAVEESTNVKQFYYISSLSVYGSGKEPKSEDSALNPTTVYGVSKMRGEEHVLRLSQKRHAVVIRLGNVYGYSASMRFDAVVNKFMFEAHYKNRISVHGNGKQHRSFIHIDKATTALASLIHTDIPSGVYNLTERNIEINDLVDTMKNIYPSLEFIFINQHLELRDQQIGETAKIEKWVSLPKTDFTEELIAFRKRFAFQ